MRRYERAVRLGARHRAAGLGPGANGAARPRGEPLADSARPEPAERKPQRALRPRAGHDAKAGRHVQRPRAIAGRAGPGRPRGSLSIDLFTRTNAPKVSEIFR